MDSDIGLCPLLGKPFGGCAGLVDIGVNGDAFGETVPPAEHHRDAERNHPAAAAWLAALEHHAQGHAVAEVTELLQLLLEVLERGPPVLKQAADRKPVWTPICR